MENEFKNYKEKQNYYKNRVNKRRLVWLSKEPDYNNNKNTIIKGRTCINPERSKKNEK